MQEEREETEDYFQNKFQGSNWIHFKNGCRDYDNKIYVNTDFYEEHRTCARKFRCNKRNPTKTSSYVEENLSTPKEGFYMPQRPADRIYETAVPNTLTDSFEDLESRAYNCKFTHDGQKIVVTTQTGTSFFRVNKDNKLELCSKAMCENLQWTITDSQISSDDKYMLHTTVTQFAHLFDIQEGKYVREFNLDKGDTSENQQLLNKTRFFSLEFGQGDKEILLGCSKLKDGGFAQIYDLETETVKTSICCHKEDVNSACYIEKDRANVFLTASDDGTAKLWDTRILKNNAPVGTFYGHVSGLTHISAKDDGRYFVTNSKDQSLKLWDIRRYQTQKKNHNFLKYDYRCEVLTPDHILDIKEKQKKLDDSLMTFWGHQVHLTLIRCWFSPLHGTGQRYIYTGSFDGRVYIYDTITGENVITLELPKENDSIFNCPVVRDCAWHPYNQTLINTSFRGGVCRWEYSDLRDAERVEEVEDEEEEEEEEEDVVICYRDSNSLNCMTNNRYTNY